VLDWPDSGSTRWAAEVDLNTWASAGGGTFTTLHVDSIEAALIQPSKTLR
jgi:hypothetical protein